MSDCFAPEAGAISVWLREICLAVARPPVDPLADIVSPIANVVLAAAALIVAFMSWRTADSANRQTVRFRREDRDEQRLRWRRTLAVDMRDWDAGAYIRAVWGLHYEQDSEGEALRSAFKSLRDRCDIEGDASGKRLLNLLDESHRGVAEQSKGANAVELAKLRHPSRLYQYSKSDLIGRWAEAPASIDKELAAADAARESERRARSERMAQILADAKKEPAKE